MPVKGGYLLAAGGGVILLWSGIRGKKWSSVLRDVVSGKSPVAEATAYAIQTAPGAFDSAGSETAVPAHGTTGALGASIASDALQYQGAGYVWGGAPGNGSGHWDCSSFVNAVIGRDLHLAIPTFKPGAYHGQTHGPNTLVWLVWTGAFRIKRRDAAAGDLAIWQTHMGIFTDNDHVIAAHDPRDGTTVTTLENAGPPGEILVVRRLKAVTPRTPGRANIRVKHG